MAVQARRLMPSSQHRCLRQLEQRQEQTAAPPNSETANLTLVQVTTKNITIIATFEHRHNEPNKEWWKHNVRLTYHVPPSFAVSR
eukprot:1042711-Amphidinium_carterae.1